MLTARELSQAGLSVTLLERQRTGRESSWAGGGIVSPLYPWRYPDPVTRLARWSQERYQALSESLAGSTGIDPQWTRSGLLILAPDEQAAASRWAGEQGIPLQIVPPQEIGRIEPALRATGEPGIWLPGVAQVRNPRLAKALRQDLLQRGVDIREECPARRLIHSRGRIEGVDSNGEILKSDRVIVCAGAWSGSLAAAAGIGLPVEPVLGQMILFRARPGLLTRITLRQDRYAIPRRDGRILFGSTLERQGFGKRTTSHAREELSAIARSLFPLLKEFPVEHHWAGLRPGSPRGIPFVTPVDGVAGLFLQAGHFRNGVVLGPASARLMADLVLDRPPIVPPGPYGLATAQGPDRLNS